MTRTFIKEIETDHSPITLAALLRDEIGLVVLESALFQTQEVRFSFVTAAPFAQLEAHGTCCRLTVGTKESLQYGSPWNLIGQLIRKYELLEESDQPFPLGGLFGYFGYEMNRSLSAKLASKAARIPELPDLSVGFYDSLCVFDHQLQKCFVVSTGMLVDGSRSETTAKAKLAWWTEKLSAPQAEISSLPRSQRWDTKGLESNLSQAEFVSRVAKAKEYISAGDIYQINLSHRLELPFESDCFDFYVRLMEVSPAPHAAFLNFKSVQIASASPESFLRLSGRHVQTRPIKGTRPRSADPQRDAQLTFELQSSQKELAELVMITDLLRNDIGQICEFGSVTVPELVRLERFPQVQHLVSTIEGILRSEVSHIDALSACFPGGSITGTPKLRAMQIIDELEPIARGPYTGAIGFIGFNQESHMSIAIRTAFKTGGKLYFNVGAGIVADSDPEAEYAETLAKGRGFIEALGINQSSEAGVIRRATPKEGMVSRNVR
ncbi:aminodeoxychorismate synthase component I [bacterium]|nr:aminodeoxychorismate synthase component I [bacterium]MDA7645263.1 aminodeoxychorismate synthase component I [bacterium]MDA7657245.1 aminodeoxychorismate synthase component I [Verrucomicrobiota bacterium]MDA7866300.1 aminodeoxychorismate synthase component I [Verrucomicrobiota bacterium]